MDRGILPWGGPYKEVPPRGGGGSALGSRTIHVVRPMEVYLHSTTPAGFFLDFPKVAVPKTMARKKLKAMHYSEGYTMLN